MDIHWEKMGKKITLLRNQPEYGTSKAGYYTINNSLSIVLFLLACQYASKAFRVISVTPSYKLKR